MKTLFVESAHTVAMVNVHNVLNFYVQNPCSSNVEEYEQGIHRVQAVCGGMDVGSEVTLFKGSEPACMDYYKWLRNLLYESGRVIRGKPNLPTLGEEERPIARRILRELSDENLDITGHNDSPLEEAELRKTVGLGEESFARIMEYLERKGLVVRYKGPHFQTTLYRVAV